MSAENKAAILVVGMHRSGTSATTRILNLLGCDLPRALVEANPTNPAGHWEPAAVTALNDEILASAGTTWDSWETFNPTWYLSPVADGFRRRAQSVLASECGDSRLFVLKDPRICRLLPFWIEALQVFGAVPFIVSPIRNPLDVATSLNVRDGIDHSIGLLMWLRHVLDSELASRGHKRAYLRYEHLLSRERTIAGDLQDRLGVFWPKDSTDTNLDIDHFLSSELHHHRSDDVALVGDSRLSCWLRSSFEILDRWTHGEPTETDLAQLDRHRIAFEEAIPAFGAAIVKGQRASQELGTTRELLAERDSRIATLIQVIAARDEHIGALEQVVAARGERIDTLEQIIAARDEHVGALEQVVAAREERIDTLEQIIAARDEHVGALEQVVAARDEHVGALEQVVAAHDEHVGALEQVSAEYREQVVHILASRSWRITAPARALTSFVSSWYRPSLHHEPPTASFRIHQVLDTFLRSRMVRRVADALISIVDRYPRLLPVARVAMRLLPGWMVVRIRRYRQRVLLRLQYRQRQTTPTDSYASTKTRRGSSVTPRARPSDVMKRLQPFAMAGQLTNGWYGGRQLHPDETLLARVPPPPDIVALATRAYDDGTDAIRARFLPNFDSKGTRSACLRFGPVDEFRAFLAQRSTPDSVAAKDDCGGFSIVTPFFRHMDLFRDTAESVHHLAQNEAASEYPLEWVVVNDDPAIDDDELMRRIPEGLRPQVRLIPSEEPGGIVHALNTGIRHSVHRWVLFLDCDDLIESNAIAVLTHYQRLLPRCRYISSSMVDIDESGTVVRFRGHEQPPERLADLGMFAGHLKAVRRDLFDDVGYLDPNFGLAQDYEFALRVAMEEPILQMPEPLYRYRWHGQTQSVSRAAQQAAIADRVRIKYLRRFVASDATIRTTAIEAGEQSTPPRSVPGDSPQGAVVIRTQNKRPGLLTEAIDSVIAQTPDLTPIVVVHGSDEDLHTVQAQVSTNSATVLLHASEESRPGRQRGYPANIALDYVCGQADRFDYVSFLDDDDIYYPLFAERMGEALRMSGADLVYAMTNKRWLHKHAEPGPLPLPSSCLVAENFITMNSFVLATSFLRRSGIRFDEHLLYLEDWDFLLSVWSAGGTFNFLPEVVSEFRITNDGNTAHKKYPDLYEANCSRVQEKIRKIVESTNRGLRYFQEEVLQFDWPQNAILTDFRSAVIADTAHQIWLDVEQHPCSVNGVMDDKTRT